MRRLSLIVSLVALIGAVWGLWNFRYERVPGCRVLGLEDLRALAPVVPGIEWDADADGTRVKVSLPQAGKKVAARVMLPYSKPVDLLHVSLRMKAHGLACGKEEWEDGRIMVEWLSPDGNERREINPASSVRDDEFFDLRGVVIGDGSPPGAVALRIEHLGRSGSYEVSGLEISVVRERLLWRVCKWFLAVSWLVWFYGFIRSWPGVNRRRALAAAGVALILGTQLVVPGPWPAQRPIVGAFCLGAETLIDEPDLAAPQAAGSLSSGVISPEGKLPDQGSFVLRVKFALRALRPLLHAMLLFGPALLMLCLVGRRPALLLMVMLALSIEFGQFMFGYGFDGTDVLDLVDDSIGIGLALLTYRSLGRRFGSKLMDGSAKASSG